MTEVEKENTPSVSTPHSILRWAKEASNAQPATGLEAGSSNPNSTGVGSLLMNPTPNPISPRGEQRQSQHTKAETSQKPKKKNSNIQNKPLKITNLNSLFGPQSEMWTKFFTIDFNEEESPNNIRIWTELKNYLGNTNFYCVEKRKGLVLVDAKTESNAEKLQNLLSIDKANVSVKRDEMMNSVRGTALVPPTEYDNLRELPDLIKHQAQAQDLPVSDVIVFPVTSKRSGKTLQIAKFTFETRALPPKITIGFREVPIKEDLPKPRQCQRCWRFGHRTEVCDGVPCCPICSSHEHDVLSCPDRGNTAFKGLCPNCGELGHTGLSKKCVLYIREYETLLLMRRKGVKKFDARRLLEEAGRFM